MKRQFWLLHALGPIPTNDADGGDLKWLGAIVNDVDQPEKEFDVRPAEVSFREFEDWRRVNINSVDLLLQRVSETSLKLQLAKAIRVEVDSDGNVTNQAKRARVVAYSLRNERSLLNRILDADPGYRDRVTDALSRFTTTRWFVAGYLVAKPVAGAIRGAEKPEDAAKGDEVEGEEGEVDEGEEDGKAGAGEEKENEGVQQEDGGASGLGAGVNADALASAALGLPVSVPFEINGRRKIKRVRRTRGDPTDSHIFAVVYRGLKKEVFSRGGVRMRDGPTGEGAFGEGRQKRANEEKPEDVTTAVALGESSVAAEVGPTLKSDDDYIDTQELENGVFDNPEDATLFEETFGGGLEFAFTERLPEE